MVRMKLERSIQTDHWSAAFYLTYKIYRVLNRLALFLHPDTFLCASYKK